jgi:hypothetical protein
MEQITEKFLRKLDAVPMEFVRGKMSEINWQQRLIGIKGARGVGKTTLVLQYIKLKLSDQLPAALYASLDNIWFSENRLSEMADYFVKRGGRYLFLDEVHKYPNWSTELKNIYDDYPGLKIVFTGSSMLEILNARADLSRRAIVYSMQGLSFREYLNMTGGTGFRVLGLEEILENHTTLAGEILKKTKPLQHFSRYLQTGYYPFFTEQTDLYPVRLEEVINMILEIELPMLRNVDLAYINKIKQLLRIISQSAPFVPNITKLSERIGINRQTLLNYLFNLKDAQLIHTVYKDAAGITRLQKPDKIFLENTNLMHTLGSSAVDKGNCRETFFANQLKYKHKIEIPDKADFLIDGKLLFEIGGKQKSRKQVRDIPHVFVAADDIEYGFDRTIPLWLFGFLY